MRLLTLLLAAVARLSKVVFPAALIVTNIGMAQQTKSVLKSTAEATRDHLTESIVVPSGKSITINSGATIINNGTATGFSSGGTWGSITGTLSNQTDLQSALNAKQATLSSGTITNKFLTWGLSSWTPTSTSDVRDLIMPGAPSPTSATHAWTWNGSAYGWASLASYLTANQTITLSGDLTGSGSTAITTTLANSGVTAGSYTAANITVDAKGRVTSASNGTAASAGNPTASVGLTAVNGSASTFLRSDAAPALDQTIAPTWTGLHTFAAGTITTSKPLTITQTWNASAVAFSGLTMNIINTASASGSEWLSLQGAGTTKFAVKQNAASSNSRLSAEVYGGTANDYIKLGFMVAGTPGIQFCTNAGGIKMQIIGDNTASGGPGEIRLSSDSILSWTASTNGGSQTTTLAKLTAAALIVRDSTTAQTLLVANTYTSATSYEAAGTWWSSNVAYIGTQKGSGGGSARDLSLVRDSTVKQTIGANTNDDAQPRKLPSYIVSGLPSAATCGAGSMAFVTDATATTAYTTVTGGGSNKVLVISDGTNWIIH